MPITRLVALVLVASAVARAAIEPSPIPRSPSKRFQAQGLYEGGADTRASLAAMRVAQHAREGFERWVIDFSDERTHEVGHLAPKFQIEYQPADKWTKDDGTDVVRRAARFVLRFRQIAKNHLTRAELAALSKKSRYVADVVLYPPVEGGDLALELVLRRDVRFEAHQPMEREGRLVLDLMHR